MASATCPAGPGSTRCMFCSAYSKRAQQRASRVRRGLNMEDTASNALRVRFRAAGGAGCLVRMGNKRPIAVGACDSPEAEWSVRPLRSSSKTRIVSAQGGDCADEYDPQRPTLYTSAASSSLAVATTTWARLATKRWISLTRRCMRYLVRYPHQFLRPTRYLWRWSWPRSTSPLPRSPLASRVPLPVRVPVRSVLSV